MIVRLPSPPSTNRLYRNVPRKGRVKTGYYNAWLMEAGLLLNQQRKESFGKMNVHVALTVPNDRRRDIDNYAKATLDLLTAHGIWLDDSQVQRLTIERSERPDMLVEVISA